VAGKYMPLKLSQVSVLRWIAAGCPDGVMEGDTYKTTAVALQNRNLVRISKGQGRWVATVLPDGQYYLDHGEYDPAVVASYEELMGSGRSGTESHPRPQAAKTPSLPEPTHTVDGHRDNADQPGASKQSGNAQSVSVDPSPKQPNPRRHLHPAVSLLPASSALSHISKDQQRRALRLLQGLAAGAVRRGLTVEGRKPEPTGYVSPSNRERGLIFIDAGARRVGVDVRQHQTRSLHQPTKKEVDDSARFRYTTYPKYDFTPNERLHIVLHGAFPENWEDLQRTVLEERLEVILDAAERASVRAREAADLRHQQDEERRRQWEVVRHDAELMFGESHRADVLLSQLAAWQQSEDLGRYLTAMEARVGDLPTGAERLAAADWLNWAKSYRLSLDPLAGPLHMPTPPEPNPEALKPFMKGLNPHGPERGYF
jgi:hypothetical protein